MSIISLANICLVFLSAPLLFGIIQRTKAYFAGRKGQPVCQLYFDLYKLSKKGAVYSGTTTWVFKAGPAVGFAAISLAVSLVPFGRTGALFAFSGDIILFAYLLGLMRFFTIIAALDTGSSFEGMGASREAWLSIFAEPTLFIALATLVRMTGKLSLTGIYSNISFGLWQNSAPVMALLAAAIIIVFLTENCRIPVDDPNTHLELTMIHEVMALDHSGPELGLILYSAALKFWVLGALFVGIVMPVNTGNMLLNEIVFLTGMIMLGVFVGVIESIMARLNLLKVPQFLISAMAISVLAFILGLR